MKHFLSLLLCGCATVMAFSLTGQTVVKSDMDAGLDQAMAGNWEGVIFWMEKANQDEVNGFLPSGWTALAWEEQKKKKNAEKAYTDTYNQLGFGADNATPEAKAATVRLLMGEVYLAGGRESARQGHWHKAIREFSLGLIADKDEFLYFERGMAQTQLQKFSQAQEDFELAFQQDSTMFMALTNLGLIAYKEQQYEKAELLFRKSEKLQPGQLQNLLGLGNIYLVHYKDNQQALKHYRATLERNPDYEQAWTNLRITLKRINDPQLRVNTFIELYELTPYRFDLNYELGVHYAGAGKDPEKAKIMLEKAVALQPSLAEPKVALGALLVDKRDFDAALPLLEEATKIAPDNALAWHNKGVAQYNLGQIDDAQNAFAKARTLDPSLGRFQGK